MKGRDRKDKKGKKVRKCDFEQATGEPHSNAVDGFPVLTRCTKVQECAWTNDKLLAQDVRRTVNTWDRLLAGRGVTVRCTCMGHWPSLDLTLGTVVLFLWLALLVVSHCTSVFHGTPACRSVHRAWMYVHLHTIACYAHLYTVAYHCLSQNLCFTFPIIQAFLLIFHFLCLLCNFVLRVH